MRSRSPLPLLFALGLSGCSLCPPGELGDSAGGWLGDRPRSIPFGQACPAPSPKAPTLDFAALGDRPFIAFGGGGAPSYNEIALEKNILYFQRSLAVLNPQPPNPVNNQAALFFANGNDGQATLRYLNGLGFERFKAPEISGIQGPATRENLNALFAQFAQAPPRPRLFYFTGHGNHNPANEDNNDLILWQESLVSVQEFTKLLDQLPATTPLVVMMAQCYSGSFANLIYRGGDPEQPLSLHSRCGFFATTKDLPSVGCTPEVNEADYRDYSSSFFAGLTGIDRLGQPVASADYNGDRHISYSEAHAFAKLDEETSDRPISTLEAWLQRQIDPEINPEVAPEIATFILNKPLQQWQSSARPERAIVIEQLTEKLGFDPAQSWLANLEGWQPQDEVEEAYGERLRMELINVAAEKIVQAQPQQRLTMQRLMDCEGSWP